MVDKGHIFIFQKNYNTMFIKTPTTTEAGILYNLAEEEWESFCNDYIDVKFHNPPPVHIITRYLPYKEDPTVHITLEYPQQPMERWRTVPTTGQIMNLFSPLTATNIILHFFVPQTQW